MTARRLLYLGRLFEPDAANSRYVQLTSLRYENQRTRGGAISASTRTRDPNTTPPVRTHYQRVWPAQPNYQGKLSDLRVRPAIKFSCTCERWTYMWEYPMYRHRASDIIFGNGQPAFQTNPGNRPSCCKHGIVVLNAILLRGL